MRRLAVIGLAAIAIVACKSDKKSGPALAKGDGFTITVDDFKKRLDEQSPFMRSRYTTVERKKEFLDNLVQLEVLAREAEKQGYREDPEVQQMLRRLMVQKLVRKFYGDPAAATVPDEDVQKYYDAHSAEFHRPKRVRSSIAVFALASPADRAKKLAVAKKALATIQAAEKDKKDPDAFRKMVMEVSEDAASKPAGGDIGAKTAEELESAFGKELSQAVFGLKQGEVSGVIEGPKALYLARVTMVQEEVNRTLDQVKPQIVTRLSREKRAKEFEEWVKKLKGNVTVDEKALEAIEVSAAVSPAGAPGAAPGTRPPPPGVSVQPAGGASAPPPKPQ